MKSNADSSTPAILANARAVLDLEAAAIERSAAALDAAFADLARALCAAIDAGQKLIFTGVGKNVPICQKLTGTFNSTGVPSCFLDPNQALHGDLGLCAPGDHALLFSNSGETEDILRIVPFLKRLGVQTTAVTAAPQSNLAQLCDATLLYHYEREACPLNLAPTASTTAALAVGDALAMCCLQLRDFSRDDFARFHPAGSLGKLLLMRVDDIMRTDSLCAIASEAISVKEALLAITKARTGSIALTDPHSGQLTGVFSDGDFRRAALQNPDILTAPVSTFMTRNPKQVRSGALAAEAIRIFEKHRIDDLIVVDAHDRPIGTIDGQDVPKLRLM